MRGRYSPAVVEDSGLAGARWTDTAWIDAVGQAELVRSKEVSPLELVDAAITRIERLDPYLNAVIHRMYEKARAAAESSTPGLFVTSSKYVSIPCATWRSDAFRPTTVATRRTGNGPPVGAGGSRSTTRIVWSVTVTFGMSVVGDVGMWHDTQSPAPPAATTAGSVHAGARC